jgi:hypothetical protein
MAESSNLEYCVLRYVPNVIGREGVSIAAIFIDPSDSANEVCAISFAADWPERIRLIDPGSDLEMIEAMVAEIRDRLRSLTQRDMLHQMEDSFSNTIQLSKRRKCPPLAKPGSLGTFAYALLEQTSSVAICT